MVDELFFTKENESVYYWLGFILTDGHIRHSRPHQPSLRLSITLAEKDENHLALFKKQIKHEKGWGYNQSTNSVRLTVCNTNFVQRIADRGVPIKNKSYVAKPLKVPKKYAHHFWRGVFDGDGSIVLSQPSILTNCSISLVGTKAMCIGLSKFLGFSDNKGFRHNRSHDTRIWEFRRGGSHNVLSAYQKLYKNATIYLSRKRNRFVALESKQREFWEKVIKNTIPGSNLTRRQQYYRMNQEIERKKALDAYYRTSSVMRPILNARTRQYRKDNLVKIRAHEHAKYVKNKTAINARRRQLWAERRVKKW